MGIRVHQLAKELGIESKELISRLQKLGIKVSGHMSSLEEDSVSKINESFKTSVKKQPAKKPAAVKKPKAVVSKPKVILPKEPQPAPTPVSDPVVTPVVVPVVTAAPQILTKAALKKISPTVKDFAQSIELTVPELIKRLMKRKVFATINQTLEKAVMEEVALELNIELEFPQSGEEIALTAHKEADDPKELVPRGPVVTFMGHVDHGKTSLLDYIRKTRVAAKEAGGITQHIGAYQVQIGKGKVTFLDTPGHEAFTALRARGANATDVVVLVVAADDGVMPQTVEAIDHARAANVPIVVAINKCDLPTANLDRIRTKLAELNLLTEDWGGKTIAVPVSAKTGTGVDTLLEMLLLETELLELKANPKKPASGVVIEAKLTGKRGAVATVLVQNGTLRVGDPVLCGSRWGKIRALWDDHLQTVQEAAPAMPVEILGLSGVPEAGDKFYVLSDVEQTKEIATKRLARKEELGIRATRLHVTLEDLYQQIKEGKIKGLKLITKADVQGSLEVLNQIITRLATEEVKVNIIHSGVGDISESDVMLAAASDAIVIGFHVRVDFNAQASAARERVDLRTYDIIYEVENAVRSAMEGLLEPEIQEQMVGKAEVIEIFTVPKIGAIAGCKITDGKIHRKAFLRVIRGKDVIFKGKIGSLKRFKEDVREVLQGFECGLGVEGFNDVHKGDLLEAYEEIEKERKLARN
jgi:translation initiation factor IF-2